jgi:hypothetical protein
MVSIFSALEGRRGDNFLVFWKADGMIKCFRLINNKLYQHVYFV